MNIRLFLATGCLAALPQLVNADSHFQLWKVYVGPTNINQFQRRGSPNAASFAAADIREEAKANSKSNTVLPNETPIECKKGLEFGIAYYIRPQHTNFVSFDLTWDYPHLKDAKGTDHYTVPVVQRKWPSQVWELKLHVYSLKQEDLVDGDIILMLHNEKHLFLRHAFQLRGCDPLNE